MTKYKLTEDFNEYYKTLTESQKKSISLTESEAVFNNEDLALHYFRFLGAKLLKRAEQHSIQGCKYVIAHPEEYEDYPDFVENCKAQLKILGETVND